MADHGDDGFVLDIFGQQPQLRFYTQISLIYALDDQNQASSRDAVVHILQGGLGRLATHFPWVAGQVVCESGTYKIRPYREAPQLVVRDLAADPSAPTLEAYRRARFPCRMLDEDLVAPRHTVPHGPGESPDDPEPVLLVQATFVGGGLIVTLAAQHAAMDFVDQGAVMRLLQKACRGEPFSAEDLAVGNMDRRNVVPLLDESYEPGPELYYYTPPSSQRPDARPRDRVPPPPPPSSCTWAYFSFSRSSLVRLKEAVAQAAAAGTGGLPAVGDAALPPLPPYPGYISTDDALTCLVWRAISRARAARLEPTTTSTLLTRAVDVRPHLRCPPDYPGMLQILVHHEAPLARVIDDPGAVARTLRAALDRDDVAFRTRAIATASTRAGPAGGYSPAARVVPHADVMLSSWVQVPCCDMDLGLGLGPPEAVRRPGFTAVECLTYLLPRGRDGEVVVMTCLRDEDLARLRADEEFARYGEYVG